MQSPSVSGSLLKTNSTFFPPTTLHIPDTFLRECASSASIGASRIVKVASDISGLRIAGPLHGALMSEAQDIPTTSTPYVDLEWISRHPTVQSQPIILGFSLPPRYLSCTASCSVVVNVFSHLVSFIRDCQAWDKYIYTPTDNTRIRVRDSSPRSSFALIWIHRNSATSRGPGPGMKTGIEICSVHSVPPCAQISSRCASTILELLSLTLNFI